MPTKKQETTTAVATQKPTQAEQFTSMVLREFSATVSEGMAMTPHQRKLAQHLFIRIDSQLKELEVKRQSSQAGASRQPIIWQNVNLNKLAIDTVHRVELGLDALIQNHIHPIPYWNSRDKKYDLDLRIGYEGKNYYRQKVALDPPLTVIYELVYSTDKFRPIKKGPGNDTESYELEITKPFDRGEVVGGFGYIVYKNPVKNKLVLIQKKQLDRSRSQGNKEFWTNNPDEMMLKTIVHRVTDKIAPDPQKITESYYIVEAQDAEVEVETMIWENANKEVLAISPMVEEQPGEEQQGQQKLDDPGF